ncbi:hypothetical protein SRABI84_00764 [Peribacillus simplex]|nr:hypothetical protein SRABI84_00764 [Peribacillus simplex]
MQNKRRLISAPYLNPYGYRSFIHGLTYLPCSFNRFLIPLVFPAFFYFFEYDGSSKNEGPF